jgi:hypothetical protein
VSGGLPVLEQLEPRLLLSADLPGIQPILTYGVLSAEQAVFVDLSPQDDGNQPTAISISLTRDETTAVPIGETGVSTGDEDGAVRVATLQVDELREGSLGEDNPNDPPGLQIVTSQGPCQSVAVPPNDGEAMPSSAEAGDSSDKGPLPGLYAGATADQIVETLTASQGPPAAGVNSVVWEPEDGGTLVFCANPEQSQLRLSLSAGESSLVQAAGSGDEYCLYSWVTPELSTIHVVGSSQADDTLTVNLSEGLTHDCEIVYEGGDGGYDSLVLVGSSDLEAQ